VNEPWFDANAYAWIPGTMLGLFGALLGTLMGVLGPRGKGRGLLRGLFAGGFVGCSALAVAGVAALALGQPYGVWYGLLLPGVLGVGILLALRPALRRTYEHAEARRMEAHDLG
jgi:peptidoglycan/LPS O-acetylase OafA/YrhL